MFFYFLIFLRLLFNFTNLNGNLFYKFFLADPWPNYYQRMRNLSDLLDKNNSDNKGNDQFCIYFNSTTNN